MKNIYDAEQLQAMELGRALYQDFLKGSSPTEFSARANRALQELDLEANYGYQLSYSLPIALFQLHMAEKTFTGGDAEEFGQHMIQNVGGTPNGYRGNYVPQLAYITGQSPAEMSALLKKVGFEIEHDIVVHHGWCSPNCRELILKNNRDFVIRVSGVDPLAAKPAGAKPSARKP